MASPSEPVDYLSNGRTVTIHHSTYGALSATVVHTFPRSMTPVVLARVTGIRQTCPLRPGLLFVMKVYDQRFLKTRSRNIPWKQDAEREGWRMYLQAPITINNLELAYEYPSSGNDAKHIPRAPDSEWERYYMRVMAAYFQVECKAYHLLYPMQGSNIPIFYGSGTIDLSRTSPRRAYNPSILLLEYIPDAVTLEDIDPRTLNEPVMQSMLDAIDLITNKHEVVLTDVHGKNFLFAPANKPTRAVILDFADAWGRADEDDEGWKELVRMWKVKPTIRLWLRRKFEEAGLRVPPMLSDG